MPKITRTYDTDLEDLAYQIGRSHSFLALRDDFAAHRVHDDEAQGAIADLIEGGGCRLDGDRGEESLHWALGEREAALLISRLYRDYLGGD